MVYCQGHLTEAREIYWSVVTTKSSKSSADEQFLPWRCWASIELESGNTDILIKVLCVAALHPSKMLALNDVKTTRQHLMLAWQVGNAMC